MIRPPGFAGAAFGTAAAGDLRVDHVERAAVSAALGIPADWAFVKQVHGATVLEAAVAGDLGEADALVAYSPGLPIAVATADCVPIVVEAAGAVAVVHAGWRGAASGVLAAALQKLEGDGHTPARVGIGPAIGPCCYEVGADVADLFPGFVGRTTWGTPSVDIPGYLADQVAALDVWRSEECTFTSETLNSWRRDRTTQRQVSVAWLRPS